METFNPACIGSQKGFRLLAVRILPECAPYIRKCLVENEFYYLNNDYRIKENGDLIERRSEFVSPIRDDFFQTGEEDTPRINISAIVGKNGDGKSTIVEVIIRLLNNFAFDYEIGEKDSLKKAEGLCAELYYQLDGKFYRLDEKKADENRTVSLCRYENDKTDGRLRLSSQPLAVEEIESFFYTLVTNYSHYAYNTLEVDREVEHGNDKEHWLHRVFHKNDGYQVPLSLHPYRNNGVIDTNTEVELSKLRILMTFVNSSVSKTQESSELMKFNGKSAYELVLCDSGCSKLQEITITKFFIDNADTRILKDLNTFLKSYRGFSDIVITSILNYLEEAHSRISVFDQYANKFFEKKVTFFEQDTDFDSLQQCLSLMNERIPGAFKQRRGRILVILKAWIPYAHFSWSQILRLILINDVCNLWRTGLPTREGILKVNVSPEIIFKSYNDLTNDEKCFHYLIYKTISIFETYPLFGNPCFQYENLMPEYIDNLLLSPPPRVFLTMYESLKVAFQKLAMDWNERSYVTLKLRQAYNYHINENIQKVYNCKQERNNTSDGQVRIKFDSIDPFQKVILTNPETLPPDIFHWDIIFSKDYGKTHISMETFSSGEKQKLYSQTAIVYHLQNISSIGHGIPMHYHSVNIILEEIELYFHPDWQRTFCNDLMEMIRTASVKNIDSVNITFVTHSPYILSDIPKTNVLFLKNGCPDYSMQENTFGANINTLLKNGFFLPSLPIGEFAHQKINSMFKKLQSGEFDKTKIDELKSEVMMVGEPYIRQQLMTLLRMYMGIDKNMVKECIREL